MLNPRVLRFSRIVSLVHTAPVPNRQLDPPAHPCSFGTSPHLAQPGGPSWLETAPPLEPPQPRRRHTRRTIRGFLSFNFKGFPCGVWGSAPSPLRVLTLPLRTGLPLLGLPPHLPGLEARPHRTACLGVSSRAARPRRHWVTSSLRIRQIGIETEKPAPWELAWSAPTCFTQDPTADSLFGLALFK